MKKQNETLQESGSEQPLLSICIPTYKRPQILKETLEHLAEIDDLEMEVVIFDDYSEDETVTVAEAFRDRFLKFRFHCQAKNCGTMINTQAAMSLASGKYSYTLSDDDRVIPATLKKAIVIMEGDESIVAVYCGHQEWNLKTDRITDHKLVGKKIVYGPFEKITMFEQHVLPYFPVVRTEIFQRYCFYDELTFGFWRLIAQLFEHGSIAIIPELVYTHVHTEPRYEHNLTEAWYHEKHRSDFELFFASLNRDVTKEMRANVAQFVSSRSIDVYMQGYRFARVKNDYLTQRHYLLKASAYGIVAREAIIEWEFANILYLVSEKIIESIKWFDNLEYLVFEKGLVSSKVRELMADLYEELPPVLELERDAFIERENSQGEFYIAEHYETLEQRKTLHKVFQPRQASVHDVISTVKLTNTPIVFP